MRMLGIRGKYAISIILTSLVSGNPAVRHLITGGLATSAVYEDRSHLPAESSAGTLQDDVLVIVWSGKG